LKHREIHDFPRLRCLLRADVDEKLEDQKYDNPNFQNLEMGSSGLSLVQEEKTEERRRKII
jgi:hypothetical protein